jgi:hypothetical protein
MSEPLQSVVKVYAAVLDRIPEPDGADFYYNQLTEEGATREAVTEDIVSSPEGEQILPDPHGSAAEFVFEFYQQAFHRAPRQDAVEFWTEHLEEGGAVWDMIAAAGGDDYALMRNKAAAGDVFVTSLVDTGMAYPPDRARSILDELTPDMSVEEARTVVLNEFGVVTPALGADIA